VAKRLTRIALLLAMTTAGLAYGALPASGAPLGEVRFLPTALLADGLAAGPESEMWIAAGDSTARVTTSEPPVLTLLNTTSAPTEQIVAGSDGNMWFAKGGFNTEIGRITPAGEISVFNGEAAHQVRWMTLGPEGNVWYTAGVALAKIIGDEYESSAIGRITPTGQASEFTAGLSSKPLLGRITTGPDGDLWFVNDGTPYTIGRVTPTGEIKEFELPKPWLKPNGIAAGVDGNVYFGASGENEEENTESLIMQITPSGEMKETTRLSNSEVTELATGPEGSEWFTGKATELGKPDVIGRLTAAGTLEEELASVGTEPEAHFLTPGPDGNMWFVVFSKTARKVGLIGTSAPAAAQAAPVVTGADQAGSTLSCSGATWSTWAGQQPSASTYGFDGYTWMLEGSAIAGQTQQSLLATSADVGHQISCAVRATYKLLNVTVSSATSAGVSIAAAPIIPPAPAAVSALTLPHQTDKVTSHGALHVTLDCIGAPCSGTLKLQVKIKVSTGKGKHKHTKTVPVTIASASFSALAVGVDKLALKLSSRGLSMLRADHYKLATSVNLSYISTGTTHARTTGTIQLLGSKPKPKSKKH
jgi:virginiamycin B lyase